MASEKEYIISSNTTYDHEEELYYTKVGMRGKDMPLHYIVCGQTVTESRERAKELVEILEKK